MPALPRKPCLGILLCAVPGILLSDSLPCNLPAACVAILCFSLATVCSRHLLPFCLLAFTVFFTRHDIDWHQAPGRFPIDLLSQGDSIVQATGIVTSDPVPAGYSFHSEHSRFEVQVTSLTNADRSYHIRFPVQVYWTGPAPVWGDEVSLTASISPVPLPRNPAEFNPAAWLARKGIFAQLTSAYASDNTILAHAKGNPLIAWARNARAFLQRRLSFGIDDDPEIAGLIQTITLGVKQETSVADRELFQHVGALHLFVVNGLHVALLACILGFLLRPIGIRRGLFAAVIIPILFAYALLTGLNPGSVRAAIMAAVVFGASFVERRPFSFNSLAAAALILLIWDTNELFNEGFQFSFGVVAAIILLAGGIEKVILPCGLPDPFLPRLLWSPLQRACDACWRRISGLAAISIAASIGSFPFSAGYFNLMTPSGFLANLLLVPIAFCILAESIFSVLSSWVSSIALLFNNTNWALATCMLGIVHFFSFLPGGHFFVSTSSAPPPACRLTILDLEPGQAIVIESQGSVWLIDCGNASSYARIVRPYLESRGVNRLDGLVLTHGAAPSMGAAQSVIGDFSPRQIIESTLPDRSPARRALEAALDQAGLPKTPVETGDHLQLSPSVDCSILFPPAGFNGRTAADKSLILRIQDGAASVLLMSDSAFTGEHWLTDNMHDLNASVVVIDGQSPDLAGASSFIATVHPIAAIRGEPGYAAPASLDRQWSASIFKQNVAPFIQSATGAVTIDLTPTSATVSAFGNNQHLTKSLLKS